MSSSGYVIVTPVRDEQDYLAFTLESVVRQTILPREWVIVNDGSTDGTASLIDTYSRAYPWIRRVDGVDRGFRKCGGGIIEAFYTGYNALECRDWEYLAKLDGDLSFAPSYFEEIMARFDHNHTLGIAGGTLFHLVDGQPEIERCPAFHVRGGTKTYRRACWQHLGGLWIGYGSDTIDELTANMHGWTTMSFCDLLMEHHRYTGASYGRWGAMVKNGKGDYASGYHPLFMLAKCCVRLSKPPILIGSLGLLYGFLLSYVHRLPRVDTSTRQFTRRQQMARLFGRQTIWK